MAVFWLCGRRRRASAVKFLLSACLLPVRPSGSKHFAFRAAVPGVPARPSIISNQCFLKMRSRHIGAASTRICPGSTDSEILGAIFAGQSARQPVSSSKASGIGTATGFPARHGFLSEVMTQAPGSSTEPASSSPVVRSFPCCGEVHLCSPPRRLIGWKNRRTSVKFVGTVLPRADLAGVRRRTPQSQPALDTTRQHEAGSRKNFGDVLSALRNSSAVAGRPPCRGELAADTGAYGRGPAGVHDTGAQSSVNKTRQELLGEHRYRRNGKYLNIHYSSPARSARPYPQRGGTRCAAKCGLCRILRLRKASSEAGQVLVLWCVGWWPR